MRRAQSLAPVERVAWSRRVRAQRSGLLPLPRDDRVPRRGTLGPDVAGDFVVPAALTTVVALGPGDTQAALGPVAADHLHDPQRAAPGAAPDWSEGAVHG